MAGAGWLLVTAMVLALTLGWWIVVPFYLGRYRKGPKPASKREQFITLAAGVLLTGAWWFFVIQRAPL